MSSLIWVELILKHFHYSPSLINSPNITSIIDRRISQISNLLIFLAQTFLPSNMSWAFNIYFNWMNARVQRLQTSFLWTQKCQFIFLERKANDMIFFYVRILTYHYMQKRYDWMQNIFNIIFVRCSYRLRIIWLARLLDNE